MALTLDDVDSIIIQAKPDLLDALDFNILLHAELERAGVITKSLKDELQPEMLTRHEKIYKLLDNIGTGPVERFLWFCQILHTEGQGHLLPIMGVDINQIQAQLGPTEQRAASSSSSTSVWHSQKQHHYRDMETQQLLPISSHTLPAILQHCKGSLRMLMRTTLFGQKNEIPLDLAALYIKMTTEHKSNERTQSIGTTEMFMQLDNERHSPNTLLLEGEAGSGKTSFLNDYAHSACKDLVDCHNKGPDNPCPGHEWKLVVLLEAGAMQGTQEDAIIEHLLCDDNLKDILMTMIREDGQGILILNDAADELRKINERESMRQYTIKSQKTGKPKVLVSSRNGLSHIEARFFDRVLVLTGFTIEQGVQYMEKYLKVRHNLTQHPVLDYVKQHKDDFDWILCNPLRLHIFSELTAVDVLKLQDIPGLSTITLLNTLHSYILTRDEERYDSHAALQKPQSFFKLCLQCLLTNKRQIRESELDKSSPYFVFLNPQWKRGLQGRATISYSFIHEVFFEFFSVEGLLYFLKGDASYKKAVLLYLCSDMNMRNVLKLTIESISKYHTDLQSYLTFIVQACLILQTHKHQYSKQTTLTEGLQQLPAVIQNTFPLDIMSYGLNPDQTRIMEDVERSLMKAYNEDAEQLRQAGWLLDGFEVLSMYRKQLSVYQRFIWRDLVSQCSPSQQEEISTQSTHCLLPCTGEVNGTDFYMVPVSSTHWGIIQFVMEHCNVLTWSPQHVVPVLTYLTEWYHRQAQPDSLVIIYLNELPALWGEAPQEAWTPGVWAPILRELLTHRVGGVSICAPYASMPPLDGLLLSVQETVQEKHSLTKGLYVLCGWVSEGALFRCVRWAHQVLLKVVLQNITIVESGQCEGGSDSDLRHRVHAALDCSTTELKGNTNYMTAGHQ